MDNKIITLPASGKQAEIKTMITGLDKRNINSALFDAMSVDASGQAIGGIPANTINKMQDKAIEALLVRIGDVKEGLVDVALALPSADYDYLMSEIDKIKDGEGDKKK